MLGTESALHAVVDIECETALMSDDIYLCYRS